MLDGLAKVLFFQQLSSRLKELGMGEGDFQLVVNNSFPMVKFLDPSVDLDNLAVQLSRDFFPTVVENFIDPNNPDNFELTLGFASGFRHSYQFYQDAPRLDEVVNSPQFHRAMLHWIKELVLNPNVDEAFETFYNLEEDGAKPYLWTNPSDMNGFEKFISFWLVCDQKGYSVPKVSTKFDPNVTIKDLVMIYRDLINKVTPATKSLINE